MTADELGALPARPASGPPHAPVPKTVDTFDRKYANRVMLLLSERASRPKRERLGRHRAERLG